MTKTTTKRILPHQPPLKPLRQIIRLLLGSILRVDPQDGLGVGYAEVHPTVLDVNSETPTPLHSCIVRSDVG